MLRTIRLGAISVARRTCRVMPVHSFEMLEGSASFREAQDVAGTP